MMNINIGMMACLIVLATTVAQAKNQIEEQVARLSVLYGESYIKERDLFLENVDAEMLEKLREMLDNRALDWKMRVQAGILVERHEHGSAFVELVETNWLKDPEFDERWLMIKSGPINPRLLLMRYREGGFWYHYFEHFWKDITTPGMQHRYNRRGEADLCPQKAFTAMRDVPDIGTSQLYAPETIGWYIYKWALEEATRGEPIADRGVRIEDQIRRRLVVDILLSKNTRESRQALIDLLKQHVANDTEFTDRLLVEIIRKAEYKDEADLYQNFFDEYLKELLLPHSPTYIEAIEELIDTLRHNGANE